MFESTLLQLEQLHGKDLDCSNVACVAWMHFQAQLILGENKGITITAAKAMRCILKDRSNKLDDKFTKPSLFRHPGVYVIGEYQLEIEAALNSRTF